MTWELRGAGALGMTLITLVVASIMVGGAQVLAIELGELQAVASSSPPYIFASSAAHLTAWRFSYRRGDGPATP